MRKAAFATLTASALLALAASCACAAPAAAAAAAPAAASVPPAKQALIDKILKLSNIDSVGEAMLQAPVGNAVEQARVMLQGRAAPEKRDAAMTDIVKDAKAFMADNAPLARNSADKLIPSTVAPMLAENFSEEELRQLAAVLESPVGKKFYDMLPAIKKKLGDGITADTGPVINPKLKELNEKIGLRLRTAVTP